MRIKDILQEKVVESSWIKDIAYDGKNVTLTVRDGRKYLVKNVPANIVRNWTRARSKGTYWNKKMNGYYKTIKIA